MLGDDTVRRNIIELVEPDAIYFMKGFYSLTHCEQKIITFLLGQEDKTYFGTFASLGVDMGEKWSYNCVVSPAMNHLEKEGIVIQHAPSKWYHRRIELCEEWIERLVEIGKRV